MTNINDFDAAITLVSQGDGVYLGETSPAFANFNGQFGGITAALLMRAVLSNEKAQGSPVSITVHYTAAVSPGPFTIRVRDIRRGRTLQHWAVEMDQGGKVTASAMIALAARQDSWGHAPVGMPAAPPYSEVQPFDTGNWKGWATQYDFRFVTQNYPALGEPPFVPPRSAHSLVYMRHAVPRPLDFEGLTCMSDAFIVRMLQVRNTFPAMGTVALTTHFHCTADMLAAQGDQALLCSVDSSVFRDNFHDQSAQLWSHDGALLCTTHQIVWYAE